MASDPDLPPNWIRCTSQSHPGRVYYFNTVTRESSWEKPTSKETSVRASHILIKHSESRNPRSWKQDPITRSKEEAIEILKEIRRKIVAKEARFEEIASTESDCSSAKRGGDLGHFTRGQMQKPFEDAAHVAHKAITTEANLLKYHKKDSGVHIILRTA